MASATSGLAACITSSRWATFQASPTASTMELGFGVGSADAPCTDSHSLFPSSRTPTTPTHIAGRSTSTAPPTTATVLLC